MATSYLAIATASGYFNETSIGGSTFPVRRFPASGTGDSSSRTITITSTTNATPIVVNATAHNLQTGHIVTISGITGNTNANGRFRVTRINTNSFSLTDAATDRQAVGNGTHGGSPVCTSLACLVDAGQTFGNWAGLNLEIRGGTGAGQIRTITGAPSATTAVVHREWDVQPDATSQWVAWVKRGPIFVKSYRLFAGTAAMGDCNLMDGQSDLNVRAQMGPAAGNAAGAIVDWAAQSTNGLMFMDGPYVTLTGTGAWCQIEFERT